jgi:hypothetical protein
MREFQRVLEDCQLSDLGYRGPQFTWTNDRQVQNLTLERLDRAVGNGSWNSIFGVVDVQVLPRCFFYHNPLMLTCSYPNEVKWQKSRRFRFEASWLKHPEYPELIKQVWRVKVQGRDKWRAIQGKLHVCKKSIQQ